MTSLHELEERPQGRREWSGWVRSLVLPLGLVVAIVAGLLWYQSRDSSSGEDGYGTVALPEGSLPAGATIGSDKGNLAPDFLLETLDGGSLRLSDLRGRPVLVNFWASWCVGCRQETPELIRAQGAFAGDGLVVVGVNLQEGDALARSFAQEFGIDYPVALDRRGEVARSWRIGGPTQGLPASYFIDAGGIVQKVVWGALRERDLNEGLALILGRD
jgi:cytochrome c biogenesis protein CcmG/thiol:disulfide interchange protein DsbE